MSPEQAYALLQEHGTQTAAAAAAGVHRRTFARWLDKLDPAVAKGMEIANTNLIPASMWIKTKTHSIQLKPQLQDQGAILDRMVEAFSAIPAFESRPAPVILNEQLCTVYPLMDAHFGMLAWGRETGEQDYDLELARRDTIAAFESVMNLTPASAKAVLLIGGDALHADDSRAETPKSKHKLDVDGRHYRVLDSSILLLAEVAEKLLEKHGSLTIRVLRGNHDEHSHLVLTFALQQRYRAEPRVEVEDGARDLFMFQWGRSAIFAHHGDKAKPQQLALYLSDVCPFWSETRHRHILTGHVHHDQAKDLGPVRWESLRAFCPPDAYAASMGYGGRRGLQALTFHTQNGCVLRAMDPIERQAA